MSIALVVIVAPAWKWYIVPTVIILNEANEEVREAARNSQWQDSSSSSSSESEEEGSEAGSDAGSAGSKEKKSGGSDAGSSEDLEAGENSNNKSEKAGVKNKDLGEPLLVKGGGEIELTDKGPKKPLSAIQQRKSEAAAFNARARLSKMQSGIMPMKGDKDDDDEDGGGEKEKKERRRTTCIVRARSTKWRPPPSKSSSRGAEGNPPGRRLSGWRGDRTQAR